MRLSRPAFAALFLSGVTFTDASAAEGMWTFDRFPFDKAEKAYGFKPDQAQLDRMRMASLRIKGRCSASFVSPQGLVQTNHHCVTSCLRALSKPPEDPLTSGFYANEAKDELKCSGLDLDQLIAITDVTERLNAVTAKEGADLSDAIDDEKEAIIKECANSDAAIRCEVVEMHGGALHNLYKFRTHRDVRLVLAPERAIASFGGTIDDFEFPRFTFDVAFLRVYVDDVPLDTSANYFPYAKTDAQPDDVVLVPGSPGFTDRHLTVAQLEFRRDVELARGLTYNAELRGLLTEFARRQKSMPPAASSLLNRTDSAIRYDRRRFAALGDPTILKSRAETEKAVRDKIAADPALLAKYGDAWDKIAQAIAEFRGFWDEYQFTGGGRGLRSSELFRHAQTLVRYAAEMEKPEDERLAAFTQRRIEATLKSVTTRTPIDPEFEKLILTFSLTTMRDTLGPNHPLVKLALGRKSPRERAVELVEDTSLASFDVRNRLVERGKEAIVGSNDPMLAFARTIDPEWRAIEKEHGKVEEVLDTYRPVVAQAIFAVRGDDVYPEANFTPRVSFGAVKGYRVLGRPIDPITTIGGLFEHTTGTEPYKLPERWLAVRGELNLQQPLNFVSTNDLIGGFSGSAGLNKAGEVIAVMFDINAPALGGYFGYDPAVNRAIGLNIGAVREALAKVYKADRIVEELAK